MQQNGTIYVAKKSITMGVITAKPEEITDLNITAVKTNIPKINKIFLNYSSHKASEQVVATIYLPQRLLNKASKNLTDIQRITVFVYDNDKFFLSNVTKKEFNSNEENIHKAVKSKILAASIKGAKLANLSYSEQEQVRTTFSTPGPSSEGEAECVFWDFGGKGTFSFLQPFLWCLMYLRYICVIFVSV